MKDAFNLIFFFFFAIKVFIQENPNIEKPASNTVAIDRENTQVLSQRKSSLSKGKKKINENNCPSMSRPLPVEEEEDESVEVPLIRKHSNKSGSSKARSTISESIIHRLASERMPTDRVTGESLYSKTLKC